MSYLCDLRYGLKYCIEISHARCICWSNTMTYLIEIIGAPWRSVTTQKTVTECRRCLYIAARMCVHGCIPGDNFFPISKFSSKMLRYFFQKYPVFFQFYFDFHMLRCVKSSQSVCSDFFALLWQSTCIKWDTVKTRTPPNSLIKLLCTRYVHRYKIVCVVAKRSWCVWTVNSFFATSVSIRRRVQNGASPR